VGNTFIKKNNIVAIIIIIISFKNFR